MFGKDLCGGAVVEDFTRHIVHVVSKGITVLLGEVFEGCAFWVKSADQAVCVFVTATLPTGIGVAVVDLLRIFSYAVIVAEF